MSQTIIAQLWQILDQLQPAPLSCYSPEERQTLSNLLTTTITNLRTLYPDHLSSRQRHQLLGNLALLEQQHHHVASSGLDSPSCTEWGAIHISLQATIVDTLSD